MTINTKNKMYRTNSFVKKWLLANGYHNIYMFPHLRFSKDYHLGGQDFDGLAAHNNKLVLFQIKTNRKATKRVVLEYEELAKQYGIEVLWFNYVNHKGLEINNQPAETFNKSEPQIKP